MQHVADDDDATAGQAGGGGVARLEMARQREQIEQTLAGMAVQAVAGVEHRHPPARPLQVAGQAAGHAGATVAHHQNVGPHGHVGEGGIQQALPLAEGAGGGREALHIGGEPPGRQLEAAAGAGARLEEQAGHQPALQGGELAGTGHRQGTETLGQLENGGVIGDREGRQIQHMAMGPAAQRTRSAFTPQP